MAAIKPIEMSIEEARAVTGKTPLKEVLQDLKAAGLINHFLLGKQKLLIWENKTRRLELAFYSSGEDEATFTPHKKGPKQ